MPGMSGMSGMSGLSAMAAGTPVVALPQLIAHTAKGGNGTQTSSPFNSTGATVIIVATVNDGVTPAAVEDNLSNNYDSLTGGTGITQSNLCLDFAASFLTATSASHKITVVGSYCGFCVAAFTLVAVQNDDIIGFSQGDTTTFDLGAQSTSTVPSLVIAGIGVAGATGGVSISPSGFAITDSLAYSAGVNLACSMAYFVQTQNSSFDPKFTLGSAQNAAGGLFAFS